MGIHQIEHAFVEYIPGALDDGILYVSIPFATATHKCFCGCGWEVTTPIAPNAWELAYNGRSVSLSPSVGSRNLLTNKLIGPYDRSRGGRAESEALITG